MPKTHLRQPEFASSACRPFTKNKERIKKSTEKGESRYIYQNQVDKACFNIIWLTEILRIYVKEQLLMKY